MIWIARALCVGLDLLVPRGCLACGGGTGRRSLAFCESCGRDVRPAGAQLLEDLPVFSGFLHRGAAKRVLARIKYEDRPDLVEPLVSELLPRLTGLVLPRDACLVPVPLHPLRLVERGYNQSLLVAQSLGRHLGMPRNVEVLARRRAGPHQVGSGRQQRRQNVQGAFSGQRREFSRSSAILVDDVLTTGSTLLACRQALQTAGIRVAMAFTLTRASDQPQG